MMGALQMGWCGVGQFRPGLLPLFDPRSLGSRYHAAVKRRPRLSAEPSKEWAARYWEERKRVHEQFQELGRYFQGLDLEPRDSSRPELLSKEMTDQDVADFRQLISRIILTASTARSRTGINSVLRLASQLEKDTQDERVCHFVESVRWLHERPEEAKEGEGCRYWLPDFDERFEQVSSARILELLRPAGPQAKGVIHIAATLIVEAKAFGMGRLPHETTSVAAIQRAKDALKKAHRRIYDRPK